MERSESSMVLLAVFVSRFEAIVIASMLRGYGLLVSLDGEAHASVAYNSLALGGHRLRVSKADYEAASDILRQAGEDRDSRQPYRPARPLLWLVGLLATFYTTTIGLSVIAGTASLMSLFYIPLGIYSIPLDPKGKPDYFLAQTTD